jgi:hypothetical protein
MNPFRIPLAGSYNTRVSAVNASDTASGYTGVGIVGLMIVGRTTASVGKDARYVNCFAQTVSDEISGKKTVYTVKRPGFGTNTTPATGKKGYGILVWTGKGNGADVIAAFDNPSTIYNGTSSLGSLSGKCTGITETFVSSTPTLAITSDDSTGWYYDTGSGLTKISDVDFPGNAGKTLAGTFSHIDGYACILCTDGTLFASDLNSLSGWTATSFDSANAYPDKGIACVRQGNFILTFGTESLQFFYNAGLTPFPMAKATAKTVKVGCISADAIGQISDNVFWAGSTPQGGLSVFQFDGTIGRISTPEIDAQLILAGAANITITTIRFYGRSFVLVNCSTVQTFAYCVEEKMWHEWSSITPLWYKCAASSLGGTMVNYAVSNVSTSGKVYLMNHASLVFTDDGTTYTARVQLPKLDLGTNRTKFWGNLELIADIETGSSPITLFYTDDDYQTYTTWGTLDLSQSRNIATRTGSSRRRGWGLSHAANTPMRLECLEWPNGVQIGSS